MVVFITPALTTDYNTVWCSYLIIFFQCQLGSYRSSKYGILDISVQIWLLKMSKVMSFHSKISMHLVQLSGNGKMACNLVWQYQWFCFLYIYISFNSSLDWVWSYIHNWKSYSYEQVNATPPVTETPLPGFNIGSLQDFMLLYCSNTSLE